MKLKEIKKCLVCILAIVPFIAIYMIDLSPKANNNPISISGSFQEFNYEELKQNSSVIALVEITDNLTNENSVINLLEDSITISGFYGKRTAKVIKYYKNTNGYGENLTIIEPAIITKENQYIHLEDYEKMECGNKYIVFLSDSTESGNLSIISGNNGKINVSNFNDNDSDYNDILIKSIVEFETNESTLSQQSKTVILNSEKLNTESEGVVSKPVSSEVLQKNIPTNLNNLNLESYYDNSLKKEIIDINGVKLISNDKLVD